MKDTESVVYEQNSYRQNISLFRRSEPCVSHRLKIHKSSIVHTEHYSIRGFDLSLKWARCPHHLGS
jgi:hypothetical protein